MISERKIIARIRKRIPSRSPGLRLGIGDDAAVLRSSRFSEWVVSCDAFLEDVHFLAAVFPPEAIGYKALARAASDLAAMGARPRFFLLTLALPQRRTGRWLDGFLRGMSRAARQFEMTLAGGDTSRQERIAISVTVLGLTPNAPPVLRSGARPGDLVFVSGPLGAAQLALELIHRDRWRMWKPLLVPHFYPRLRLDLGQWLARNRIASAMIDTSDGLSTDLRNLCQASRAGARLWRDRIPVVRIPPGLRALRLSPLQLALHGGEDYQLLFTVRPSLARRLPRSFRGTPLACIGEMTRGKKIELLDPAGRSTTLRPRGWDHFQ